VRTQRSGDGQPLDLRDDNATVIARSEGLVDRAEYAALMFVGEVAALVRRRRPDNGDLRVIVGKNSQSCPAKATRLTIGSADAFGFIAQPSRAGSTKVSIPTWVSTPGRLAAASRCKSNRIPEGML